MTRLNAALNEVATVDVRDGSFFEPVRGERFDLIATNPPFVISPATGERLVYRDSGLPGDRVVEDIVRAAPGHLTAGGWCQVLANWVIERGRPWDERLADLARRDCDALVVQREVVDPATYVELWLKDAGLHGGADYVAPLRHLAVVVRRAAHRGGRLRLDQPAAHRGRAPRAAGVAVRRRAADRRRRSPSGAARSTVRRGRRDGRPPRRAARRTPGDRRAAPAPRTPRRSCCASSAGCAGRRTVDTVEAALVGACDGDLASSDPRRARGAARAGPRRCPPHATARRATSWWSRDSSCGTGDHPGASARRVVRGLLTDFMQKLR